jgi:uncharacterized membrane protein
MVKTALRVLLRLARKLYIRVMLIGGLAIVAVAATTVLEPLLPEALADWLGADAVDRILDVIANSMLAVTIFSLTIMTAAYRSATAQWTPRSLDALREDTVTHSVLATFIGAYVYALIAIILRATDAYGAREDVVLFGMTVFVVAMVIYSIVRWVSHIETLGSLDGTADRIEEAAIEALTQYSDPPNGGAQDLTDPARQVPADAVAVRAPVTGYVQQIFHHRLNEAAEEAGAQVYVPVEVGAFVNEGAVLAQVSNGADDLAKAVLAAIPISRARDFVHDPGFGLTALSEIACRALSPGINDPGTAIDMIGRVQRILGRAGAFRGGAPQLAHLWLVPLRHETLVRNGFAAIAREAGTATEVHAALARALEALMDRGHPEMQDAAREFAAEARARADRAVEFPPDRARLGLPDQADSRSGSSA